MCRVAFAICLVAALFVRPQSVEPQAPAARDKPPTGTGLIVGQVVDGVTGKGVAMAVVSLSGGASVITTNDGHFVFRDLPAGDFYISAWKGGYATNDNRRQPEGNSTVHLDQNQRRGDVVIRVWKLASIAGMLVDEAGEPLVRIRIVAIERRLRAG